MFCFVVGFGLFVVFTLISFTVQAYLLLLILKGDVYYKFATISQNGIKAE